MGIHNVALQWLSNRAQQIYLGDDDMNNTPLVPVDMPHLWVWRFILLRREKWRMKITNDSRRLQKSIWDFPIDPSLKKIKEDEEELLIRRKKGWRWTSILESS
jgi:hypothetical protein